LIAHHIERSFSQAEIAALRERLNQHHASVAPLTRFEHQTRNVRCPLLVENRCSVYSARPFACRRYHSSDVNSCQYSYDHPTDTSEDRTRDSGLDTMWNEFNELAARIYLRQGYDAGFYELGGALKEALDNPHARKRWRRKQKAFPSCPSHSPTE
jgi:Fe-S-cluster containining protein